MPTFPPGSQLPAGQSLEQQPVTVRVVAAVRLLVRIRRLLPGGNRPSARPGVRLADSGDVLACRGFKRHRAATRRSVSTDRKCCVSTPYSALKYFAAGW